MAAADLVRSFHHSIFLPPDSPSTDFCSKVFVISVIALGFIAIVVGVLALLASKGVLPYNINVTMRLSQLGVVNSSLIIGGGAILFALGTSALVCQLRKIWNARQIRSQ